MKNFKIGDKVKQINGIHSMLINKNKIYTIKSIVILSALYTPLNLSFEELRGYFAAKRFKLVDKLVLYPTLKSDYL